MQINKRDTEYEHSRLNMDLGDNPIYTISSNNADTLGSFMNYWYEYRG